MYQLIYDEEIVKGFFNGVVPPLRNNEVYFVSLSARKKYLTEEEREEISLGRAEMFERRIIREPTFERFIRTLRKFETNFGSYTTKNDSFIPQNSIIIYFNINPSDVLKTYKEFNKTMNEYMYELANCSSDNRDTEDVMKRIRKQDTLLMNCFQKNRGTKHYLDVDFDIPKDHYEELVKPFVDELNNNGVQTFIIDTKGGYHVLLKKDTIKYNFNKEIEKANKRLNEIFYEEHNHEIILNKNDMIPLPGTMQGGYPVSIL